MESRKLNVVGPAAELRRDSGEGQEAAWLDLQPRR